MYLIALLKMPQLGERNCKLDLPLEQTEELSPGSPLSVPLSWSSLRSESAGPGRWWSIPWPPPPPLLTLPEDARPCSDRSRGPSVDEAGDTGEPPPALRPLSDKMSVIINRDRPRWCRGMVPAADAAVSSCTVIAAAAVCLLSSDPRAATAAASPAGHCCSSVVALRPDTVAVVTRNGTRGVTRTCGNSRIKAKKR